MSEIYVDVLGIAGLFNQIGRVREDAVRTLEFVKTHCDLDVDETGILGAWTGPHSDAYATVTAVLQDTIDRADFGMFAVNQIAGTYAIADQGAMQGFDDALVREINPFHETVDAVLVRYPGLKGAHEPFQDAVRPLDCLTWSPVPDPPEQFDFRWYADLLSPSAWLRLGTQKLLGVDPFEYWLKLLGSGDWSSYQRVAITWAQVANIADALGTNLVRAAQDLPTVWRGHAAFMCQNFLTDWARALRAFAEGCRFYSARYQQATGAAKETYAALDPLFSQFFDWVEISLVAAGIGTAGIETVIVAIGGYTVAGFFIWKAFDCYNEISAVLDRFEVLVHGVGAAVSGYQANHPWHMPDINVPMFPVPVPVVTR